ncbi:MAG: dCMP deaminase family protein [bacterium]
MIHKINKDSYYLNIARTVAEKSNCLCVAFGCVIVKDDQIISTGYVGAPRKTKDCIELGFCIRRKNNIESGKGYEMCRSVHAEMNAIINAGRSGVSLLNGDMYLHTSKRSENGLIPIKSYPCLICKKMIINAGINRFIGNNENNELSIYTIADWVKDWQDLEDITQDKDRYKCEYK